MSNLSITRRNFDIFQQVIINNKSLQFASNMYSLSRTRVSQICIKVFRSSYPVSYREISLSNRAKRISPRPTIFQIRESVNSGQLIVPGA